MSVSSFGEMTNINAPIMHFTDAIALLVRNFITLRGSPRPLYNSDLCTRGRVDSSLSALCTSAPRVRSSPALTCLPLTFLTLRGQRSTFVAFKRCDSRSAIYTRVSTSFSVRNIAQIQSR